MESLCFSTNLSLPHSHENSLSKKLDLFFNNTEALAAIGMDLSLLDKAEAQPGEIAALLAQSNGERMSNNSDRIIRDKTYAYLKLALDEIRRPIWPSFEKLIYEIGNICVKDFAQNFACELHFF